MASALIIFTTGRPPTPPGTPAVRIGMSALGGLFRIARTDPPRLSEGRSAEVLSRLHQILEGKGTRTAELASQLVLSSPQAAPALLELKGLIRESEDLKDLLHRTLEPEPELLDENVLNAAVAQVRGQTMEQGALAVYPELNLDSFLDDMVEFFGLGLLEGAEHFHQIADPKAKMRLGQWQVVAHMRTDPPNPDREIEQILAEWGRFEEDARHLLRRYQREEIAIPDFLKEVGMLGVRQNRLTWQMEFDPRFSPFFEVPVVMQDNPDDPGETEATLKDLMWISSRLGAIPPRIRKIEVRGRFVRRDLIEAAQEELMAEIEAEKRAVRERSPDDPLRRFSRIYGAAYESYQELDEIAASIRNNLHHFQYHHTGDLSELLDQIEEGVTALVHDVRGAHEDDPAFSSSEWPLRANTCRAALEAFDLLLQTERDWKEGERDRLAREAAALRGRLMPLFRQLVTDQAAN